MTIEFDRHKKYYRPGFILISALIVSLAGGLPPSVAEDLDDCVQFFNGHPDSGGTAIDLSTIERIGPDSSRVIKRAISGMLSVIHRLYFILDPCDVISETDEENNAASAATGVHQGKFVLDIRYSITDV